MIWPVLWNHLVLMALESSKDYGKMVMAKKFLEWPNFIKFRKRKISFKKVNLGDELNEPKTESPKFICLLVTFDSQKAEVSFYVPRYPMKIFASGLDVLKIWYVQSREGYGNLKLTEISSAKRSQSTVNVHQTENTRSKQGSKLRLLSSKSACPIKMQNMPPAISSSSTPLNQTEKTKSQVSLAEFRLLHRQVIL